jgi:hypothetical protein
MKNRKTYKTLCIISAVCGLPIARMYLGEPFIARLLTVNWFFFGGIIDLAYMDKRFDEAMAKRGYFSNRGNA